MNISSKKCSCGNQKSAIRKRKFLLLFALCAMLLALSVSAEAQQTKKVPRIGFLGTAAKERIDAFRQGLRDLGWIDGRNIIIESLSVRSEPDRVPGLAAELVRLKVDVIVTPGARAALAARQVTTTIPIVMASNPDPVEAGFVGSFARPGGNVTGLFNLNSETGGKRLELLKETVTPLSRVAVLRRPLGEGQQQQMSKIEVAARALVLQLYPVEVREPDDFKTAFAVMTKRRVNALLTLASPQFTIQRDQIINLTLKYRFPAVYADRAFPEAGGLMSYGANHNDLYRRAATYVDKILKGAKPADLPVEQPTKFELVINLKAAKQIGLMIPPNVLARADKVIK
jgi:putative ABC transport system substrate-binding protein